MAKPIKGLLVFVLAAGGVGFFFVKMYRDDIKALHGFLAAYDHVDGALGGPADRAGSREGDSVLEALDELQARAELRLSSLIRNDGELMHLAREIAALAKKEHQSRSSGREGDSILLGRQRKTAFERFIGLSPAGVRVREAKGKP